MRESREVRDLGGWKKDKRQGKELGRKIMMNPLGEIAEEDEE